MREKTLADLFQECIDEDILVDFLKRYGTEVIIKATGLTAEELETI